jgi:hypothetical protein
VFLLHALVVFFNLVVLPTASTNSQTPWVKEWTTCIVDLASSQDLKTAQNYCANKFSSNLPSFGLLIFTNALVASVGAWVFIIFGFNMQLLQDWWYLFSDIFQEKTRMKAWQ